MKTTEIAVKAQARLQSARALGIPDEEMIEYAAALLLLLARSVPRGILKNIHLHLNAVRVEVNRQWKKTAT